MANAEDLNRLTSCSLVLLSHVFLSIGNSKESMNMVTPAMQLASKIPDIHVQLWGSAILKDLHRMSKDTQYEKEALSNHVKYSESLIADQLRCVQSVHHNLIDWLKGPPPPLLSPISTDAVALPNQIAPTTVPVPGLSSGDSSVVAPVYGIPSTQQQHQLPQAQQSPMHTQQHPAVQTQQQTPQTATPSQQHMLMAPSPANLFQYVPQNAPTQHMMPAQQPPPHYFHHHHQQPQQQHPQYGQYY